MFDPEIFHRENTGKSVNIMSQTESETPECTNENSPAITEEDPLRNQTVRVVTDVDGCKEAIALLREQCDGYPVLGFDCEWVRQPDDKEQRVALLELATHTGLCALIRLNKLDAIPAELRDLLNDTSILKVGIDPFKDATLLQNDEISVRSTLDLRHLACKCDHPELDGLAKLADSLLGIKLDKNWKTRASDWEAEELAPKQIKYAANDAHVAVELFRKLAEMMGGSGSPASIQDIIDEFEDVFDQQYRRPKQKKKSTKK